MFEKEAEKKYCKGCKLRIEQCLWAWRNTNGLNEPNEKNCSCIKVPAYIAGAEFGYNKAKKEVVRWHILVENPKDVPVENSVVKVLTEDNIIQESTYFYDDYFEEMAFSNVGLVKVLAWKKIVLPELKEDK